MRTLRILRPYRLPAGVALATVVVLWSDALTRTFAAQVLLGAAATVTLITLLRGASAAERRTALVCVAVSTVVELFGSVLWGVYRYRLHNVPLYVPPGHGLVYLSGLRLAATPLFARRPRRTAVLAVVGAGAWALFGLTLSPALFGRPDILGAFFFVYFACFALRSRRGAFFAAIFVLTSLLELGGTALGDWTWAVHAPGIGIGVGNPPSVIAGAYCAMDAIVILLSALLARRRSPSRAEALAA